ncbi:MAG: hypothetical protein R3F31_16380 [Verrucomicrobiales bacterium]
MIVDVHTHAWIPHFGSRFREEARRARAGVEVDLTVRYEDYAASFPGRRRLRAIVFGGKASLSGIWVDDRYVANYVAQDPSRLVGFLSVDPTQPGWESELKAGHLELGLRGIKLLPMYAGFRPDALLSIPLGVCPETFPSSIVAHWDHLHFRGPAGMHPAPPSRSGGDPVSPGQDIMAHLGHPYEGGMIAVIRKHPNVFADLSPHYRPHQLYHSLMLVQEYGVWDKVLFGTGLPLHHRCCHRSDLLTLGARFAASESGFESCGNRTPHSPPHPLPVGIGTCLESLLCRTCLHHSRTHQTEAFSGSHRRFREEPPSGDRERGFLKDVGQTV